MQSLDNIAVGPVEGSEPQTAALMLCKEGLA
jgi:hypothetical protein